jgi:hypothetical protein
MDAILSILWLANEIVECVGKSKLPLEEKIAALEIAKIALETRGHVIEIHSVSDQKAG